MFELKIRCLAQILDSSSIVLLRAWRASSFMLHAQRAERAELCWLLVAMFDTTTISYHYCVSNSRVIESIGIKAVESNGGTEARN